MRNKATLYLVLILMVGALSGCVNKKTAVDPDVLQIRNICNLATLECYYHNVAKSEKKAGSGISHIGEKDRTFWIEYTGVARLGIDMSKVEMKIDGNNIELRMPPAKVLSISIDKDDLGEDSFILSGDGWNKNKITAYDQTQAINDAQMEMKKMVTENSSLLLSAQNRAKTLIENYIIQLGEAAGVVYNIKWTYIEDGETSEPLIE